MYPMKNIKFFLFILISLSINGQSVDEILTTLPDDLKTTIINDELMSLSDEGIVIQDSLKQVNLSDDNDPTIESNPPIKDPFFAYSFFETSSVTNTPVLDLPLQADYKLSFNDELELLLIGNEQRLIKLRLDLSGNVLLPEIGSISLLDLSLSEADQKISSIIKNTYIGTESYLSVSKPSLKKISVIGAVKQPGTYLVNPFISLTESIKYAGGLTENSSLRSIKIIDSDDNEKKIDLYDFLVFGKRKNDINLQNGDTVIVPATSKFVEITGEVLRPLIYEYTTIDSVENLIEFSLGTKSLANLNNISAYYISKEQVLSKIVGYEEYVEDNLLELHVGKLATIPLKSARITGDSVQSGTYEITKGEPLSTLIKKLKFSGDIYPFYFLLKQSDKLNQVKENYNLSLADKSTYENIVLKDNVEVYFFTLSDFLESNSELNFEEEIPKIHFKGVKIGSNSYSIPIVGKFSPENVSNLLDVNEETLLNDTIIKTTQGIEVSSYELFIDASNVISFTIPAIKVDKFNVEIRGQVNSPGIYEVDATSTLAELYQMAGGLKSTAFSKGLFFSRESIKEKERSALKSAQTILHESLFSISNLNGENLPAMDIDGLLKLSENIEVTGRISGNFDENSEITSKLFLEENDYVFIPSRPTTVTIFGEVLNPITTNFEYKLSYRDYIDLAGGFSKYADKKSAYVIRANGESFPLNFGAFQKQIYIEPGDTIVIPKDLDRIGALPLVSIATKIISDISFAAAALNALSN